MLKDKASRRQVLCSAMAALAGGVMVSSAARADDADDSKVDKSVVQYQWSPNKDGSHCGICANFIAPGSCKVVAGKIDPNGYCIAFAPKDQK